MKRRVMILFGGRSAEHEISCISARSVMDALDPQRYEPIAVGIDREGAWHLMPGGPAALESPTTALPAVSSSAGSDVALDREPGARSLVGPGGAREEIDVVFPVLHGPYGEDGATQGMLELAGIPYVGAGVLASALGMDKAVQKVVFAAAGLPVVAAEVVDEPEWEEDPQGVVARAEHLGYPLFAKPATLGSSVGVTKVHHAGELRGSLEEAFRYARKGLLERSIEGAREIECAVLGNDDPVASVAGEIIPGGEFYDYRAKYLDGSSELAIPADLRPGLLEEVQRIAVAAFEAIDCAGMARVDFFLQERAERDGRDRSSAEGDELFVNEINTIPGFTQISMYPKLWEASGVSYPDLIDRLLELAIERHERERKRSTGIA
jgi:D-alanine-D-alanine ligase